MIMRFLLPLVLALLIGAPSAAQDVPAEGSTIKEKLVLGRSTFALPPGEWQVVATDSRDVTRGGIKAASAVAAYVVQVDASRTFIAGMFHEAPLSSISTSSWNDSLCDRRNTLFYNAFSDRFDFPECLRIDHIVQWFSRVPSGKLDRKVWDWFRKNKVRLPVTVLNSYYRKYFSGDYVQVNISVNPEWFGQEPAVKTIWAESEWEPLTYDNDPKRKAFVENLKKWSYAMADNARATLRDRKPKVAMLPPLDELRVK